MTTGAPGAASSTALAPGGLARLWQLVRAGTETGELTAKPEGGRIDTLRVGVGVGPDGDAGGERRWLLFHGHTRYLRSSNP